MPLGLLATLLALGIAVAAPAAAQPAVPGSEAVEGMVAAVLARPVPAAEPGRVVVREAAGERDLRRGFLADLEALPAWRGEAIVLESGVMALPAIVPELARLDLLSCNAAEECRLAAPLIVAREATLVIDGIRLELEQAAGALISAQGALFISDAEILGWDGERGAPALTDPEGRTFRPWIAGLETNRTVIRRSRLAHLGYFSNSTQGLAFTDANRDPPAGRPEADIVDNRIEDLYFGFFTFGADGVRLLRNQIEASHVYGVDPHDFSRNLLIAENFVRGTRDSHGFVLSHAVYDTVVVRNRSIGNGGAGFFVDKGSWNVTFAANEAIENGTDGIVVYESRDVRVTGNYIADNGRAGVRVRAAADVSVLDNVIHHNAGPGIFVYDWSHAARPPGADDRRHMLLTRVTLFGNKMSENDSGDCSIQGEVTLLPPPAGAGDCRGGS